MMQGETRAFPRLLEWLTGRAQARRHPAESRYIYVTNFLAIQGVAITIFYLLGYLHIGLMDPFWALLPLAALNVVAIVLNSSGAFMTARHLLISSASFYIFLYANYLGWESDTQISLFTSIANAFLLFPLRRWRHVLVAVAQPIVYLVMIGLFRVDFVDWQPAPSEIIAAQSLFVRYSTAFMLLVTLFIFALMTLSYEMVATAASTRLEREMKMVRLLQDVAAIANNADSLPIAATEAAACIRFRTDWIGGDLIDVGKPGRHAALISTLQNSDRGTWQMDPATGRVDFALPIVAGGKLISALVFELPSGKPPPVDLIESLDNVGRQLGILAERERARDLVGESHMKMIAAAKMATLGEMAGGIAHEINNPLAVIQGYLARIDRHSGLPQSRPIVQDAIANINTTIHRITKIVAGLRSFARDSGADPYETVRLDRVISDTLALSAERFKNRGISLVVAKVPTDLCLDCRPTQISQVLLNLLNNAYDAVVSQPEKRIELTIDDTGDELILGVTDSGPGIPAEISEKILEPFFTTKPVGQGTGLGLSISKGLIESHGGSIAFTSKAGQGTHFSVRLPKRHEDGAGLH